MLRYKLILLFIFSIPLLSSQIVEESVIKSQKALFIPFEEVGTSKSTVVAPVYDCSRACEEINRWSIPLNSYYISEFKKSIERVELGNSFDLITKEGDIFLLTGNGLDFGEKSSNVPFSSRNQNFSAMGVEVERYTGTPQYQKPLKTLLQKSLFSRISLKTNLKPSSSFQNRVLSKSYFYFLHIDHIDSEFRVMRSRKDGGFSISTDIDLVLKMALYRYNPVAEKFVPFADIEGSSLSIGATNDLRELYSINYFDSNYTTFPTRLDGEREFKSAFRKSFQKAFSQIKNQIDEIDEFKRVSPVVDINGTLLHFQNISRDDTIRVNSPIEFYDTDNNKSRIETLRGWGRVVSNGVLSDRNRTTYGEVKVIDNFGIKPYSYTLLPEYNGYRFGFKSAIEFGGIEYDEVDIISSTSYFFAGGVELDLGYIFNSKFFSDLWLNFSLFTAYQSMEADNLSIPLSSIEQKYLYGYDLEFEYRYYLKSYPPFYLNALLGFSDRSGQYGVEWFNEVNGVRSYGNGDLQIDSANLQYGFGVGYSISHSFDLYLQYSRYNTVENISRIEVDKREVQLQQIDGDKFGYGSSSSISFGAKLHYNSLFQ
jgi:hypothetical protein